MARTRGPSEGKVLKFLSSHAHAVTTPSAQNRRTRRLRPRGRPRSCLARLHRGRSPQPPAASLLRRVAAAMAAVTPVRSLLSNIFRKSSMRPPQTTLTRPILRQSRPPALAVTLAQGAAMRAGAQVTCLARSHNSSRRVTFSRPSCRKGQGQELLRLRNHWQSPRSLPKRTAPRAPCLVGARRTVGRARPACLAHPRPYPQQNYSSSSGRTDRRRLVCRPRLPCPQHKVRPPPHTIPLLNRKKAAAVQGELGTGASKTSRTRTRPMGSATVTPAHRLSQTTAGPRYMRLRVRALGCLLRPRRCTVEGISLTRQVWECAGAQISES